MMTFLKPAVQAAAVCAMALLAGCVHGRGPDPDRVRQVIATAAARVQTCYRAPAVPFEARQIVTRLRVRYAPDGHPIGLPLILSQSSLTPANRTYADVMAQAAVAAVLRCGTMHLPPELHSGGWDDFDLTFSPQAVA